MCVVVKDRRDMMADCLDALAVQEGVDYDVVVIDNGSTDGTYEMLPRAGRDLPRAPAGAARSGPAGRRPAGRGRPRERPDRRVHRLRLRAGAGLAGAA